MLTMTAILMKCEDSRWNNLTYDGVSKMDVFGQMSAKDYLTKWLLQY